MSIFLFVVWWWLAISVVVSFFYHYVFKSIEKEKEGA